MTPKALLVGAAAGLASALLFAGLVTQSISALGLSLAAPIPIVIASLGWGSASGFVAALVSGLAIFLLTGTAGAGVMVLAAIGLPAAIAGHLAGLARPVDESAPSAPGDASGLLWYPLDRILFAIALMAAIACVLIGWLVGFDAGTIEPLLVEALREQAGGELQASGAQINEIAATVVRIVPYVQPALLVSTLVASLYLGAVVARMSGRLQRPRDDVPFEAGLPRAALAIFGLALAGSFLGGTLGTVASVFAGAFGMAFTLVGLAAFHLRTRGRSGRGLMLFAIYLSIVVLTFPILVFLIWGVVRANGPAAANGAPD